MILKLEIMQLQRGIATPACERQNEPPSLTAFVKADKRQLYVARYNFVQNKKIHFRCLFSFLLTSDAILFYLYVFFVFWKPF